MANTETEAQTAEDSWDSSWLVGTALGLYSGVVDGGWHPAGRFEFKVTCILREGGKREAVVGTEAGLWEAPGAGADWLQLHDEVLTLVQDLCPVPGDPGVLAATAYGVHHATRDGLGALRWRSCAPQLEGPPQLDDCFSTAILADPDDPTRWYVGTEAGLLIAEGTGRAWRRTDIQGTAVRALARAGGRLWAGTDTRGLLVSADGDRWKPVGEGLAGIPVFDIAHTDDGDVLVGTEEGVMVGDGASRWHRVGPPIRAAAVAAASSGAQLWLAGGSPGGLWYSEDRGSNWKQAAGLPHTVEALAAPSPMVEAAAGQEEGERPITATTGGREE